MELRLVFFSFNCTAKKTQSGKQFNFWDEKGYNRETGGFCLVKFGTGPNTELTQKYANVKVQNDIHIMSLHIYKQISPIQLSYP